MTRVEFERDLDVYIARKRKRPHPSLWKSFFANKPKTITAEQEIMSAPAPAPVRIETPVEVPISSDDTVTASEYDAEKKGRMARLFEWVVAGNPQKHDAVSEDAVKSVLVEQELRSDMKELARISITTFRQLPAHKIRELKQSSDFETFRGILKKHGLSRE